jgi:CheY-like chemotaxis protein
MNSDISPEPFVILERGGVPGIAPRPARRWTSFHGRKPSILLVDREGTGLDVPLAGEGFEVYRTTGRESALELLRAHPSILMALVRTDISGLDPISLLRELRELRPGIWIALWADDRTRAAEGYAAGAVDWIPSSTDLHETAARLLRSLPWAVRLREAAERREHRPRRRRLSPMAGRAAVVGLALALGVALAVATRAWHESRDAWSARLERFLAAMEPVRAPADREFDRWNRLERLQLLREHDYALRSFYLEQLELQRARDAMGVPPLRAPSAGFTGEGFLDLPDTGAFPTREPRPVR